jgi:opacity protein-like surface antigen
LTYPDISYAANNNKALILLRALFLFKHLSVIIRNQMGRQITNSLRHLLLGSFIMIALFVQARDKQSFVGLRSGISIPIGGYAAKELDGGSFTQAGFNVTIDGAWFFKPKFGIGGSVGLNLHPVDVVALSGERINSDPFLNNVVIRSEPYKIITAMGGVYFQLPFGNGFSFSAKLLGGLLYGKTPYQLYKPDYYLLPNNWAEITSAQDWKFSWQTGFGLRYNLSSCIDLIFDTGLFYDQLAFNFNTFSGLRTDTKTIAFINTTVGFRINL